MDKHFFYNFHKIGDFSKCLTAKITLLENDKDKFEALLGIKCHQRGTEPYFPSTSFISGLQYDYSSLKDNTNKSTNNENINLDDNENMDTGHIKHNVPEVDTTSKPKNNGISKKKISKSDTKLYVCTDDCIEATQKEYELFLNVLDTFGKSTQKNIRTILDEYDACSNMTLHDIYLLPREKRNHPKICYEGSCQGSSVLVRKLAIH